MAALIHNSDGDAVVEAAIILPIMIMIFAALVLLAMYLPTQAMMQRATQYAATAIATEQSDTWLFFDEGSMSYYWESNKDNLENVYSALFSGNGDVQSRAESIIYGLNGNSINIIGEEMSVNCYVVDKVIYKEIVATASQEFTMPVDLSFIGFPTTIPLSVTSTAVVQNADEFVRSMDMAVDFVEFIMEKYNLTDVAGSISSCVNRVASLLGG